MPSLHPLLLRFVQFEATGFEVQACLMDQFGRVARLYPPMYDHCGFLAYQERGTLILGALGGMFPVRIRAVHFLLLVGVLLVLEPVVVLLPATVGGAILALLVQFSQTRHANQP